MWAFCRYTYLADKRRAHSVCLQSFWGVGGSVNLCEVFLSLCTIVVTMLLISVNSGVLEHLPQFPLLSPSRNPRRNTESFRSMCSPLIFLFLICGHLNHTLPRIGTKYRQFILRAKLFVFSYCVWPFFCPLQFIMLATLTVFSWFRIAVLNLFTLDSILLIKHFSTPHMDPAMRLCLYVLWRIHLIHTKFLSMLIRHPWC